jgi:hypothetical protein
MTLAEYLFWVNSHKHPKNATVLNLWIEYFHRLVTFQICCCPVLKDPSSSFDANGDGKIQFDEMHKQAKKVAHAEL